LKNDDSKEKVAEKHLCETWRKWRTKMCYK